MGRIVGLLGMLIVVVVLVSSADAATGPVLRLVDRQPLTIRGQGFEPNERTRVVVTTSVTRAKTVRASAVGVFRVRFDELRVPRCGGVFATARGRAGSLARLKIPLPACLPATQP